MKKCCEKLRELLDAELGVIKKHIDEHKWFQHIENDNEGVIDFVGKYGWLMREMYCGFACKERHNCMLAKEFLPERELEDEIDNSTEETIKIVQIQLVLDERLVEDLEEYARKHIVNDREALINWAVNHILEQEMKEKKK